MNFEWVERFSDEVMRCASWGPVSVNLFFDSPRAEHIKPMREQAEVQQRLYPNACVHINFVMSGKPNFSNELRQRFAELTADTTEKIFASANVILIPGLIGVAARTILNTLSLMAKRKSPEKSFDNTNDAITWLHAFFPEPEWTLVEFQRAIGDYVQAASGG